MENNDCQWSILELAKNQSWCSAGSILWPLFFLVYISDLPDGLTANIKLFAEDTPLFLVVHDSKASSVPLKIDFSLFLPMENDIQSKYLKTGPRGCFFSRKAVATILATVYFNSVLIIREKFQKHLGLLLDSKRNLFDYQ